MARVVSRAVPEGADSGSEANRQIAFGAGPHRCLGSHLARREMRIALEEWHARIPRYRLAPGADVQEYVGMQIGMMNLPIVW